MRDDQAAVLGWALDLAAGRRVPPPDLPDDRLRTALLYTGLTALVGEAVERLDVATGAAQRAHLDEQRAAVRARHDRYLALAPEVLRALAEAGVPATPVKGIVLTAFGIWPHAGTRPMADIDVLVPPADLAAAHDALVRLGLQPIGSSATEDVFLAWGDGGTGRRDGESAGHNGKVEVHPGWAEMVHGYTIGDLRLLDRARDGRLLGAPARLLSPPDLLLHVLGHLSAAVIRRDVRALHVMDVVFGLRHLTAHERSELGARFEQIDERLWRPALWFVEGVAPGTIGAVPPPGSGAAVPRWTTVLEHSGPRDVLRDPAVRTPWQWRRAWTTDRRELLAAAREQLVPPTAHLRGPGSTGRAVTLHAARAGRALRRVVRHRTGRA